MNAPSIMAGEMTNPENEVKRWEDGRADHTHPDGRDGQFGPNPTFEKTKIKELRPPTGIPPETQLKIKDPGRQIQK
jgi:Pentose-5-phosphate-3-epimerase